MNWKQEAIKAALTFAIFVGGSFAATPETMDGWQGWAVGVVLAGSRVAVSSFVASLATWQAARKG